MRGSLREERCIFTKNAETHATRGERLAAATTHPGSAVCSSKVPSVKRKKLIGELTGRRRLCGSQRIFGREHAASLVSTMRTRAGHTVRPPKADVY